MNRFGTFVGAGPDNYIHSQVLRNNLSGIDPADLAQIRAPDALAGFSDVVNRFAQAKRNGRPLTTAPMPRGLRHLHQRMWPGQDWAGIQLMEQRRWDWGKEAFDGTRFEYTGVKGHDGLLPYKRQVMLRSTMRDGYLPNRQTTSSDQRAAHESSQFPRNVGMPPTLDTRNYSPHLEDVLDLEHDREIG